MLLPICPSPLSVPLTLIPIMDSFSQLQIRIAGTCILHQTSHSSLQARQVGFTANFRRTIMRQNTPDSAPGRTILLRSASGRSIMPLLLGLLVLVAALCTVTNIFRQAYTAVPTNNGTSSSLGDQVQSREDAHARFIREEKFR